MSDTESLPTKLQQWTAYKINGLVHACELSLQYILLRLILESTTVQTTYLTIYTNGKHAVSTYPSLKHKLLTT